MAYCCYVLRTTRGGLLAGAPACTRRTTDVRRTAARPTAFSADCVSTTAHWRGVQSGPAKSKTKKKFALSPRYTARRKGAWCLAFLVKGFSTRSQALSFEWHMKRWTAGATGAGSPMDRRLRRLWAVLGHDGWWRRHPPCPPHPSVRNAQIDDRKTMVVCAAPPDRYFCLCPPTGSLFPFHLAIESWPPQTIGVEPPAKDDDNPTHVAQSRQDDVNPAVGNGARPEQTTGKTPASADSVEQQDGAARADRFVFNEKKVWWPHAADVRPQIAVDSDG